MATPISPPSRTPSGSNIGKGLFGFGVFWSAMVLVITLTMLQSPSRTDWKIYLFLLPFWGVGVGMILGSVELGRRQTMLAVTGDMIAYRRTGLFKPREAQVRIADIRAIRIGPSGMEVNERPVMELQIHPREGKKIGLLAERPDPEIEWIAYTLRKQTGIPASA